MHRRPLRPPLFPYTTLFRSDEATSASATAATDIDSGGSVPSPHSPRLLPGYARGILEEAAVNEARSEEHTSELQSLRHLVCRLLLEKKNKDDRKTKAEGDDN